MIVTLESDADSSNTTLGIQGSTVDTKTRDPLALPSGPITRARANKYKATMNLFIQEQITQELQEQSFYKCNMDLEDMLKFVTLLRANFGA